MNIEIFKVTQKQVFHISLKTTNKSQSTQKLTGSSIFLSISGLMKAVKDNTTEEYSQKYLISIKFNIQAMDHGLSLNYNQMEV